MKENQKHLLYQNTFGRLPRSHFIYKICHIYLRHYFGFNYGIKFNNGESWFSEKILKQKESPLVFDVGANIGDWTLEILKISPNTIVHAFEPSRESFNELFKRVNSPNVKINNMGLGLKHDVLTFYEYGVSHISSFHKQGNREPIRTYSVKIMNIMDYCLENQINYIDFLKIDTEGHDFWVIKGAEPLLNEQNIEAIQFEYGPANINSSVFFRNIYDYVIHLPYQTFRLYPDYLLAVNRYSDELENFINVNYILIANDMIGKYNKIIKRG